MHICFCLSFSSVHPHSLLYHLPLKDKAFKPFFLLPAILAVATNCQWRMQQLKRLESADWEGVGSLAFKFNSIQPNPARSIIRNSMGWPPMTQQWFLPSLSHTLSLSSFTYSLSMYFLTLSFFLFSLLSLSPSLFPFISIFLPFLYLFYYLSIYVFSPLSFLLKSLS